MADILIRNVPPAMVRKLEARAKRYGRSLEAEALAALENATAYSGDTFIELLENARAKNELTFDVDLALAALREGQSR